MPDQDEREEQILNAAAAVITRLGYDKTNMSDIAAEAGVSRGTVYLYFKGKEELFDALVYWQWRQYARTWLEIIEVDPRGGTIGGYFRATLSAVNSYPLMASMMRRDQRIIGKYLRKKDTMFAWMQSGSLATDFIRALQEAGAVRSDLDPAVIGHILEVLSIGQVTMGDFKPPDQFPPFGAVMEALADMTDRWLTPDDGGDSEAGKAAIRQITEAVRVQLEQVKDQLQTTPQRGKP